VRDERPARALGELRVDARFDPVFLAQIFAHALGLLGRFRGPDRDEDRSPVEHLTGDAEDGADLEALRPKAPVVPAIERGRDLGFLADAEPLDHRPMDDARGLAVRERDAPVPGAVDLGATLALGEHAHVVPADHDLGLTLHDADRDDGQAVARESELGGEERAQPIGLLVRTRTGRRV
jgi:hypothetical protein